MATSAKNDSHKKTGLIRYKSIPPAIILSTGSLQKTPTDKSPGCVVLKEMCSQRMHPSTAAPVQFHTAKMRIKASE